ncbi:MAG TPA: type VI secretion system baseplate subunit TssF [Candidatus Binatia bacterium]|nr:type VI secretion system baseplate subunit TssF [Candidatus Binatia bacterium]
MDPRMLRYYSQELSYIREMGAEFAGQFPKVAARLALDATEVADPYVERLLEGFSFLSARVRLKLDAEFPRFTQHLLDMVYPHYLAPTPAMAIAQFVPTMSEAALASGFVLPRGTVLRGQMPRSAVTACQFRTAHQVTLWPIELTDARYVPLAPDLPLNALPLPEAVRGVLRIKLRTAGGIPFQQVALDRVPLFLAGGDDVALKLYELIHGSGLGVLVVPPGRPVPWHEWRGPEAIRPLGFDAEQALIPYTSRSFSGYRLLHEYFAFPERFRFVELCGLGRAVARHDGDEIEIAIPLARGDANLGPLVDRSSFALHCTPVVNLFRRHADRIHVTDQHAEHQVVVDRTRPMDFEVYAVERLVGYGEGTDAHQEFRPFYASVDADVGGPIRGYFTTRREPRALSEGQRRDGSRTAYVGSEVFLSLVDPQETPYSGRIRQLSADVVVTNRDLPLLMPVGHDADFTLAVSAPVDGIRCLRGPTRPRSAPPDGEIAWRLINHLSLNYLTVTDRDAGDGATALRELLELYADLADTDVADAISRRQAQAVRRIAVAPRVRRLPVPGPIVFGRGLEIRLTVDEAAFAGASAFLLGAVLEQVFGRLASMNTFTELALLSETRGEVTRWPPRMAARQLV